MTDVLADTSARQRRRFVIGASVRAFLTVALVVVIYYVVPLDHGTNAATVLELALAILGLCVIVGLQLRQIIRSDHPNVRAVEALAFTVPLYVIVFAVAYFLMAHAVPTAFNGAMTRTDSCTFPQPFSRQSASVTSQRKAKLPGWSSHFRCGSIW
jgi:voltage-gated potassium channel